MTDTVEIEATEVEEHPEGYRNYTVVAAAVTVLTGNVYNNKAESTRLVDGDTIWADPKNESIRTLLGFRSIIPTEKLADGRKRTTTARSVFEAHRKSGEATGVQNKQVVPLDAPAGHPETV